VHFPRRQVVRLDAVRRCAEQIFPGLLIAHLDRETNFFSDFEVQPRIDRNHDLEAFSGPDWPDVGQPATTRFSTIDLRHRYGRHERQQSDKR
jgi:hypothetical protein